MAHACGLVPVLWMSSCLSINSQAQGVLLNWLTGGSIRPEAESDIFKTAWFLFAWFFHAGSGTARHGTARRPYASPLSHQMRCRTAARGAGAGVNFFEQLVSSGGLICVITPKISSKLARTVWTQIWYFFIFKMADVHLGFHIFCSSIRV